MDRIKLKINGKETTVGSEVSSDVMLLDYLRRYVELRGTKYMCREGGCGACIVIAERGLNQPPEIVNSCLVSITSCHDWSITTTEAIGNRLKGYSSVQKTLADHNGTQCGYCSPSWVLTMHNLLKNHGSDLKMLDIEKSFGSNLCRCTGYRPILDAMKTFASDAPKPNKIIDIEDLNEICKRTGNICRKDSCSSGEWCLVNEDDVSVDRPIKILLKDNKCWYKVTTVQNVFDILNKFNDDSYMLVAGNTGKGAYPLSTYPDILIDISGIKELKNYKLDQNLMLGAGNTITETIEIFKKVSLEDSFNYLITLNSHLEFVAHPAVRNIGSIAGNLILKHDHNDFQSDIFVLFETVGAMLTIEDAKGSQQQVKLTQFLKLDMKKKMIINVMLPPLGSACRLVTFKIAPRAQNAVANVNAGFLYKVEKGSQTVEIASIVYGNISPSFIHAKKTEGYLKGKNLFSNDTLQQALKILDDELHPEGYSETQQKAKKRIALGLFYKGLLSLCPKKLIDPRYLSGIKKLKETRPVSKGRQIFDTDPSLWPLNKPIPKLEALIQCAGEATYIDDTTSIPHEVFAAFVTATTPLGEIESIDAHPALEVHGVISFYTVKDLSGINSFTPLNTMFNTAHEEQFCDGNVKFYNQPIGVIVAETDAIAQRASKLVNIKYKNVSKPVIDIKIAKKDPNRVKLAKSFTAEDKGDETKIVVTGSNNIHGQYHFHMEVQTCISYPVYDGIEVLSSSQWLDQVQIAIQQCLKIDENSINMVVSRLGGAFGAKLSRANQIAIACSLVTLKLNRPCRMVLPLTTNMRAIGKRLPCSSDFEAGVNEKGQIQYLNYNMYLDNGYMINEPFIKIGEPAVSNSYDKKRWNFKDYNVTTDTAKNSWMRSPGTFDHIAMTEYIMEQICYELSLDPIEMRFQNLDDDTAMKEVIETLKKEADYDDRKASVEKFNKINRWKKRGLRFVPLKWPVPTGAYFNACIAIYHGDGTVVISHSGIEMGQGINTKAAQVCAYILDIPLEKIKVKATNNINGSNASPTGGSFSSEILCLSVKKASETLRKRLAPFKKDLGDSASWEDVVAKAYSNSIDLFASQNSTTKDQNPYPVYGASIVEVELDVLTGESEVLRVDLIEDVGQSFSPEVDVGQIEGAFIMGQGYWTSENLVYDKNTGELLTDRTWNYHIPGARDIPLDFRVYFRRNSYNKLGVLGSKATGEPAICMSISVPFAIRAALSSSRLDSGIPTTKWFSIDGPYTVEKVALATEVKLEEFVFS